MRRILSAVALLCLAAATAAADDDVRSRSLALHPPASARALRYPLLPEVGDSLPGNAVDHYRQAIQHLKQDAPGERERSDAFNRWIAVALKDLPRDEMERFLKQCETTLQEVDAGARMEDCDWGLTEKLRKAGIELVLPDLQPMREIANLLALRARYELAEGRTDKALHTVQTGLAMGRHVADAPLLICALVGVAIDSVMLDRLEEVVRQPDAPSLYWALTDLPRPLIDMRQPMQGERLSVYASFPGAAEMAADQNARPWDPEQVQKGMKMFQYLVDDGGDDIQARIRNVKNQADMMLRLASRHEAAKKALVDEGRPKELVEAMPHIQVALLVALRQYDQEYDELLKWQSLPYWESRPAMAEATRRVREAPDDKDGPAIPLARALIPAMGKVLAARTRLDRRVAALRCVEAVRLHTAAHDGSLPASLDDIKDPPVPLDPVDGKPFGYRVVGDRAFFTSTPFPGQPANNTNTPTYELSFNR
jgi:hypothetical protein